MKILFSKIFIVLLIVSSFNNLSAQTFNLNTIPSDQTQFNIRYLRPSFGQSVDWSTFSGVYELSLITRPINGLNLVLKIPYINIDYEVNYYFGKYKVKENGFGNIFIGLQKVTNQSENSTTAAAFGIYLPSASKEVAYLALHSDFCRYQKYIPEAFTIFSNFAYHRQSQNGVKFGFEIGPSFIIPTSNSNAESQFIINYGFSLGMKMQQLMLNADLLGFGVLNGDYDKFIDRFVHMYGIGVGWQAESFMPKIFYNFYLDKDLEESVDGIFGLEIQCWVN